MKKYSLLTAFWLLFVLPAFSQNIAINADGSRPNPNAILDIQSGSKGLLIPRMDSNARNKIKNTKGLLVYDISTDNFWYNTGRGWECIKNDKDRDKDGEAWSLKGNGNTRDGVNFLGTTNNVPLSIRVNNQPSGRIDPAKRNTFWGYHAGVDTGTDNTALGAFTLQANSGGLYNTAIGSRSSYSNTVGALNAAIGFQSLFNNLTGNYNTACGATALFSNNSGEYNTAIGYQSMLSNTTGVRNEACGAQSLLSNSSGTGNAANGFEALDFNTSGSGNTANGADALSTNTSGSGNTANGIDALARSTTADNNTATGAASMTSNLTGHDNTADGSGSLVQNTTGSSNTSIGVSSLLNNFTGSNNTAVGAGSDVSADGLTNATVIGNGAIVDASNKVRIGNSAVTVIEGQVPFTTPSDGRYKFNVEENVKGLDFILKLRPVTYQFDVQRFDAQQTRGKEQQSYAMKAAYKEAASIRRTGFIAQEVEKAAAASGYDFSGIIKPKTERDHYSLSYDAFVVPLVKAVQEQQQIINEQNRKIAELVEQNKKIADLQNQIDELKKLIK